ncbi:glycosyltransferase family 4 protein [Rhizobacter sp. AJA081-3]|uniref:glycosyltransferase family 4 protein n=1 Tax=Rhizobacter sp. AJA081-3 TaxID=2753607 RepID=UPI001AE09AA9|nr:glycosyltransferase family 4 protein [Rhizobacter sp. AJA081-3]QTN24248.1 glycosyltransferase family 4 protein [Rhizobacter sp. AJA081-3]
MRLLVVSQYFWPENFRVNELVSELVARGHDVTVLTGRPNYPEGRTFAEYKQDPGRFESYKNARIVRVPLRPRGNGSLQLALNYLSFLFWATLLGSWRLRGRQFDAVFSFQVSPVTSALPALWMSYLKRVPMLMWVLDLWPETLSAVGAVKSPRALIAIGRMVGYIYRHCDRVLVQSQAFVASVERWSGSSARVRYFPAWVEAVFDNGSSEIAPEVANFHDSFNVMFAGNIGEAQDFPSILAAATSMKHRKDIRWLIVGDSRAMGEVRTEIERRGLEGTMILLGRHALERMPSFFKAADAMLVSLKSDPVFDMTIPGKVQSYLATGVPILGMLGGEGARVIAESGAGLVCDAGDGTALAYNVEKLAAMPSGERAAMGERGRNYARLEFDRAVLISRLEEWLSELTRSGTDPRRPARSS